MNEMKMPEIKRNMNIVAGRWFTCYILSFRFRVSHIFFSCAAAAAAAIDFQITGPKKEWAKNKSIIIQPKVASLCFVI